MAPPPRLRIFGVGVDVARVARVQETYARFGDRFLRRAFHADEIALFHARADAHKPLFLASRWAVKEATFKAFQRYRVLFPEISTARRRVQHSDNIDTAAHSDANALEELLHKQIHTALPVAEEIQALDLRFHGETATLAAQLQLEASHVSISHDGDYAMAFVVLQQRIDEVDGEHKPVHENP